MFGNNANGRGSGGGNASRPAAAAMSAIDTALTHILIGDERTPDGFSVFQNGRAVPTGDVESVTVEIVAPTDDAPDGTLTAILSRYAGGSGAPAAAARGQQAVALFPGTVVLLARDRRIMVTCPKAGSFDGLWLGLGQRADGSPTELTGVRSLRIAVAPGNRIVDARLVWEEDGLEEDLLAPV